MKSGVVMVAVGDFIYMLLGLDLAFYIEGHLYILYVTRRSPLGGPRGNPTLRVHAQN